MNEALDKILEIKEKYRNDGFDVKALRLDDDSYQDLLTEVALITKHSNEAENIDFEYENSIGICGNMEIIPDDSISEPVPEEIRGMWRDE